MATIPEALAVALQHQRAGHLAEAERIYGLILQAAPRHADALHLSGVLAHWQGRTAEALERIALAIEVQPDRADFQLHHAMAMLGLGRAAEALAGFRRALVLDPGSAEAWYRAGLLVAPQAPGAAIAALRRATAVDPRRHDGWTALLTLLQRGGRLAEVVVAGKAAVAAVPDAADLRLRLAEALRGLNRWDAAEAAYRTVLVVRPETAEAYANIGIGLYHKGRAEEAQAIYRRGARLRPDVAEIHGNLGPLLQAVRRFGEAEDCYHRALALRPDLTDSLTNLGCVLDTLGRSAEALALHRRALAVEPQLTAASMNLGSTLASLGRFAEAADTYLAVAGVEPGNADALVYAGNNLLNQGRVADAVDCFNRARVIAPRNPRLHNGLGNALLGLGRLAEAEAHFREALDIDPDYAEANNNLGAVYRNQGRQAEAVACFRRAVAATPHDARVHSNLLLTLCYQAGLDERSLFAEHLEWARRHAEPHTAARRPFANARDPERRLRIGYVSPDLREHAAAYFLEPMFERHDRTRCEIVCYAEVARPDSMTERLKSLVDRWRSTVGRSDDAVAAMVREDGIDILVDLAGHTGNNRLLVFARKPAPVQVTYLGYATTTGMSAMDYLLTEGWTVPPGEDGRYYTETIWRLPDVLRCYRPPRRSPPVAPPPALTGGRRITFGSLNAFVKVTPPVIALWSRLLLRVPDSELLLISDSPAERVAALFAAHGVTPDRLRQVGRRSMDGFLDLHAEVDVALDPFPHTGATTTLHTLWMGVPVVSLAGSRCSERGGVGILGPLGLSDLVATTPDEYLAIAEGLARDLDRLAALRVRLRPLMQDSTFCNPDRFTRQIEDAYRAMWRRWCAGAA